MNLSKDCIGIKPPYCEEKTKRLYIKNQEIWEKGYRSYLENNKWCYDFKYEPTRGDCEQSFLSQMIFGHLLTHSRSNFSVNRNYMYVKDHKKLFFHFDVMNNPNVKHELGKEARNKGYEIERKIWEDRYHTIGNFTPIPWPENLQSKHNMFEERWDKLLEYCKKNWENWDEGLIDISFNEYMKRTCQHLYFHKIFIDFKNKYLNKLDKITTKEWKRLIQEWDKEIDKDDNMEIICFKGAIEEIVDNINFLIESRGRCIISLLSQELQENK